MHAPAVNPLSMCDSAGPSASIVFTSGRSQSCFPGVWLVIFRARLSGYDAGFHTSTQYIIVVSINVNIHLVLVGMQLVGNCKGWLSPENFHQINKQLHGNKAILDNVY